MPVSLARGLAVILLFLCTDPCGAADSRHTRKGNADAGPHALEALSRGVAAETAADDRAVSMLQLRAQHKLRRTGVSLALQGGGWYSHTLFSGLVASLLHVRGAIQNISNITLKNSNLFQRFTGVTSVSGGSWFAAGLIYSPSLLTTIELMAQNPSSAREIYDRRYTQPLLDLPVSIKSRDLLVIFKDCIAGLLVPPRWIDNWLVYISEGLLTALLGSEMKATIVEQTTFLAYLWANRIVKGREVGSFSWWNVINETILRTTGLNETVTLGSTPNEWAVGKVWVPVVSQVNPARGNSVKTYVRSMLWEPFATYLVYRMSQGPGTADSHRPCGDVICEFLSGLFPMSSQLENGPHLFTPARFSVRVGDGVDQAAPLPFCADEKYCGARRPQYEAKTIDFLFWPQTRDAPKTEGQFSQEAFDGHAGKLPVTSVVAASSAVAGGLAMFPLAGLNPTCSWSNMATSVGSAPDGMAFRKARQFVQDERLNIAKKQYLMTSDLDKAADMMLQVLGDGAFVDNTGIMTAVAAGALEVFAVFSTRSSFVSMFQSNVTQDYRSYRVFRESQAGVLDHMRNEAGVFVAPSTHVALTEIRYGSFSATTAATVDAEMFGIPAGRTVLLHWVYMPAENEVLDPIMRSSGFLDVSELMSDGYNTLLQEVVDVVTHADNREHATHLLDLLLPVG